MDKKKLIPIEFNGETIFYIEKDGEPFTPLKPIIENIGLNWETQYRKVIKSNQRWSTIVIMTINGKDQRKREMVCIPIRKLAGFLSTINPGKVSPDKREKVIAYQNECDDALWEYWTQKNKKQIQYEYERGPSKELFQQTMKIFWDIENAIESCSITASYLRMAKKNISIAYQNLNRTFPQISKEIDIFSED